MRSRFPSLKDIETEAAPAQSLSNTRPDNIARDTENRRPPPAPCFFMLPSGPPRPRSSKPMPRRAWEAQKFGLTREQSKDGKERTSRGAAPLRIIERISISRNNTFDPALCPHAPTRRPWWATQPPTPSKSILPTTKKPLVMPLFCAIVKNTEVNRRQGARGCRLPRPYAGVPGTPTQQYLLRQLPL